MAEPVVIAIDGPAGAGKSTVAALVARALGLPHVDTGALYRAATLAVLRAGADPRDRDACARIVRAARIDQRGGRTLLDGEDVEAAIRGAEVTATVSAVSAHAGVRDALLPVQRSLASPAGAVVEGRDIGSVVFPDAAMKVFLLASPEERARRRAAQLGLDDPAALVDELRRRDDHDADRAVSPLVRAPDAWEFDTTGMTPEETADAIVRLLRASARADLGPDPEPPAPALRAPEPPASEVAMVRASLPRVAVVGRANVGKSTLVNRILGHRASIVEPRPGVTRDRTEHVAEWRGRPFVVVDTGGWEPRPKGLAARVVEQAEAAVATADAVLLVVDVTVGVLDEDARYARALRRRGIPVVLVANKVDSPRQLPDVHAFHELGVGDPYAVSAAHGHGVGDLLDGVLEQLPPTTPEELADESAVPRVAVVGRPNVGKSSLFNRLCGEQRSIVDPVPHTTRDAVDTLVEFDGEPWVFVDTAGLRRRYRHGEATELYSIDRTRDAIAASDLALLVLDASEPLGEQDQRLAALVRDAGRGLVLVLNKWDLVDEVRRGELDRELDRLLSFASWAPRVHVSAVTGRGVDRVVPILRTVWQAYRMRVTTGELNRWLDEVTGRVAPRPKRSGRRVRLRYVAQVGVGPPRFMLDAGTPLHDAYLRYLERSLRERYGFAGTPILFEERAVVRAGLAGQVAPRGGSRYRRRRGP